MNVAVAPFDAPGAARIRQRAASLHRARETTPGRVRRAPGGPVLRSARSRQNVTVCTCPLEVNVVRSVPPE